ncbi:GspH/FimT family pseudopilin [Paraburkholderia fungorum]|uniref:GspH/FimT family pseudopilin n=1 Tax=Paraburkholderia fungorum TaxID=134537 RepID=UPI0038BA7D8D
MRLSACKSRGDTPCTTPLSGTACVGARGPRGARGSHRSSDSCAGGRKRAAGFTLLEMMVVLVIAGILVSLTALTMNRNPRTDLNEEAQRLALLFESAGDEAQVRARPIAWQPFEGGFRFDMRTEDGWRPLRDELLGPRSWEGGVTGVTINYPGSDSHPSRVVFGTEAIDVPVEITLFSAVGHATIVGTGNGRYEVH